MNTGAEGIEQEALGQDIFDAGLLSTMRFCCL